MITVRIEVTLVKMYSMLNVKVVKEKKDKQVFFSSVQTHDPHMNTTAVVIFS